MRSQWWLGILALSSLAAPEVLSWTQYRDPAPAYYAAIARPLRRIFDALPDTSFVLNDALDLLTVGHPMGGRALDDTRSLAAFWRGRVLRELARECRAALQTAKPHRFVNVTHDSDCILFSLAGVGGRQWKIMASATELNVILMADGDADEEVVAIRLPRRLASPTAVHARSERVSEDERTSSALVICVPLAAWSTAVMPAPPEEAQPAAAHNTAH